MLTQKEKLYSKSTVLFAIFLARILLEFSRAMYMVDTAATVPLATSPTIFSWFELSWDDWLVI